MENSKICPKCNKTKLLTEFYKRPKTNYYQSWCKKCFNKKVGDRQRRNKIRSIEYLGGECMRCGYNKCTAALEFHHKNKDKEFKISDLRLSTWNKIKKELDKCDLLCSNCHKEVHAWRPEKDSNL